MMQLGEEIQIASLTVNVRAHFKKQFNYRCVSARCSSLENSSVAACWSVDIRVVVKK